MFHYFYAEKVKFKRTFVKKIPYISPLLTLMIALLSPIWFETNGYNWWYILMLPGVITLFTYLVHQKEEKKLRYRGIYSLPINLKKSWIAKVLFIMFNIFIACLTLFLWIQLVGWIFEIPLQISFNQGLFAAVIMVITSAWQIPLCLFLSKKLKLIGVFLFNFVTGLVINIAMADTNLWWLSPYSITSRTMATILGIHPNGTILDSESPLIDTYVIPIGVSLSIVLFFLLLIVTANWFVNQEEK